MQKSSSNGNGRTLAASSPLTLGLAITLLVLIVGGVTGMWSLRSDLMAHLGNDNIHHSTADLDRAYVRAEIGTQRYEELNQRLTRIEDKLDKLVQR